MMLYHTSDHVAKLFPKATFHMSRSEKVIYLTFDDGPHPEITKWVLKELRKYKAKATFFCVGENLHNNPEFVDLYESEGHTIGNHTYNHLNGWKTPQKDYLVNVDKFQDVFSSKLFRPPYGKIGIKQIGALSNDFKICLWDVLVGDFDKKLTNEQCLKHTLRHTGNGSILVFHDSLKAEKKMKWVLPQILEHFHQLGFIFEAIPA
ncbi:MAG: polysaccharide deacetylase family protein [Salibacteraceae bacterium]